MWASAGKLLQLPKELDGFPGREAGLKRQRTASRVNEERTSALPIKYKEPGCSSAAVDKPG